MVQSTGVIRLKLFAFISSKRHWHQKSYEVRRLEEFPCMWNQQTVRPRFFVQFPVNGQWLDLANVGVFYHFTIIFLFEQTHFGLFGGGQGGGGLHQVVLSTYSWLCSEITPGGFGTQMWCQHQTWIGYMQLTCLCTIALILVNLLYWWNNFDLQSKLLLICEATLWIFFFYKESWFSP